MTPEEINKIIAEKCIGWKQHLMNTYGEILAVSEETGIGNFLFDPYHRIDHAMMALEKMASWELFKTDMNEYECNVWPKSDDEIYSSGYTDTPSAAISLAIVEAMKEKEGCPTKRQK